MVIEFSHVKIEKKLTNRQPGFKLAFKFLNGDHKFPLLFEKSPSVIGQRTLVCSPDCHKDSSFVRRAPSKQPAESDRAIEFGGNQFNLS